MDVPQSLTSHSELLTFLIRFRRTSFRRCATIGPIQTGGGPLEVYLDLVMILNFLVDFLLLLGTNRLSGFPLAPGRCAYGALLGSLYSGACMLPGFRFLGNLLWRGVSLGIMGTIAFGWGKSGWKRCGVFLILSMALGGMALSVGRNDFLSLVLAAGGCFLLCRIAFGSGVGSQEYVPLTLTYGSNTVSVLALRDTGNTLRDPITGEPVLVVGADVAHRLTGLTEAQLKRPLETLAKQPLPGLRLIPYRSVGQAGSFLLGLRMEDIKVEGKKTSAVVAFAAEGLGRGEMVQALTGGAL